MTGRDIMLDLLREAPGMTTTSWDWQMDLKFAERIGDERSTEVLNLLMNATAPHPIQISVWEREIRWKITQRRLRALRKLVKEGLVASEWGGTGPAGVTDFGVNRTRVYMMKEVWK